jgi:ribosomal protein S18 acetylase RimI-like enzyme
MITTTESRLSSVRLRPVGADDEAFLFQVYASTRTEELAQVNWDEAQRVSFLRMQFQAQSRHYTTAYSGAEFQIVLVGEQPVGRLYVHWRRTEIRVMDIALLPEHCRQGIGTVLMQELLKEGERTDRSVTIHVEIFNSAQRWYERLGFQPVADQGVYRLMEWRSRPNP